MIVRNALVMLSVMTCSRKILIHFVNGSTLNQAASIINENIYAITEGFCRFGNKVFNVFSDSHVPGNSDCTASGLLDFADRFICSLLVAEIVHYHFGASGSQPLKRWLCLCRESRQLQWPLYYLNSYSYIVNLMCFVFILSAYSWVARNIQAVFSWSRIRSETRAAVDSSSTSWAAASTLRAVLTTAS